ncbi:MAG: hypothetical protein DSY55_00425 [Clostridia bacterium]|nr:MAG: hypothetical protein DSY55_00425 [Clostridia bacterium]
MVAVGEILTLGVTVSRGAMGVKMGVAKPAVIVPVTHGPGVPVPDAPGVIVIVTVMTGIAVKEGGMGVGCDGMGVGCDGMGVGCDDCRVGGTIIMVGELEGVGKAWAPGVEGSGTGCSTTVV